MGAPADRLAAFGIDAICEAIEDGASMAEVAAQAGVRPNNLTMWLDADPERSARARRARANSADVWDRKAERVVTQAGDWLELHKARELAHHYRWRASKIAPKQYGETKADEPEDDLPVGGLNVKRAGSEPRG